MIEDESSYSSSGGSDNSSDGCCFKTDQICRAWVEEERWSCKKDLILLFERRRTLY